MNQNETTQQEKPVAVDASALDALVMRRLLIHVYNSGYHAGHEDTVEGGYTDIFQCDMDSYHDDVVDELVSELLEHEYSARNEENHLKTC